MLYFRILIIGFMIFWNLKEKIKHQICQVQWFNECIFPFVWSRRLSLHLVSELVFIVDSCLAIFLFNMWHDFHLLLALSSWKMTQNLEWRPHCQVLRKPERLLLFTQAKKSWGGECRCHLWFRGCSFHKFHNFNIAKISLNVSLFRILAWTLSFAF